MKKLSTKQEDARIAVWDELIDHMDMEIYDNNTEREQGALIKKQLIRLRDNFIKRRISSTS